MKISRRVILIILILGLLVCLVLLFQTFIMDNFVRPLSLVIWMLLRVLQVVDQHIYWALLLISAIIYLLIRLGREPASFESSHPLPDSFSALENIRYWRTSITATHDETSEFNVLKRYLGKMLANAYAVQQPGITNLEIYNALKLRQIALPDDIYDFLFPGTMHASGRSLRQLWQSIRQAPRRWSRKWSGRDVEEYYRSVEKVLAFIESDLEINHDDEESDSHIH